MAELDDKVIVTKSKITDIADALREEMSESNEYSLPTMAEKVHELGQGQGSVYTAGVGIDITNRVVSVVDTLMIRGESSGSIASFDDGGANMPLKSCIVAIEPVQSGSGDASPQNERPISGWTECNLGISGNGTSKNLLPIPTNAYSLETQNGLTVEQKCGTFKITGTSTANTSFVFELKESVNLSPSTNKIAFNNDELNSAVGVYFYRDTTLLHYWTMNSVNREVENWTDTGNENVNRILIQIPNNLTVDMVIKPILCLKNESDTSFVPYKGNTYNIEFPSQAGTVYGGTLDVINGVLTVDKAIVDLGTLDWEYSTTQGLFGVNLVDGIHSDNTHLNGICEIYKCVQGYNPSGGINDPTQDNAFTIGSTFVSTNLNLLVRDSRYTDATAFKTAMNGVECVYKLTTPQTYNLTPTEVKTLLGINNIFADCGDVDVEYVRDATLIINKLLELVSGNNNRTMMKSAVVEKTDEVKEQKKDSVEEDLDA